MALPDHTPRNVVFHDISLLNDAVSSSVHELVAVFSRQTLPASFFEAMEQTTIQVPHEELSRVRDYLESQGLISHEMKIDGLEVVIPAVISSVDWVRHQLTRSMELEEFTPRLLSPIISYVETCLRAVCPRAFILQDAYFALSYPPSARSSPLSRFLPYYSKATFAFVPLGDDDPQEDEKIEDELRPRVFNAARAHSPGPSERSSSTSGTPSDLPSDYDWTLEKFVALDALRNKVDHTSDESSLEVDTAKSENQAPPTELLAQSGAAKLCVLVLGSPEEVIQALSSALYHRRAHGLLTPIVAVVASPLNPVIRITIAWLNSQLNGDGLPDVHIAWDTGSSSDMRISHGVYDLRDVGSALLFTASILSLKGKLDSEAATACAAQGAVSTDDLAWRADQVIPPVETEVDSLANIVSTWVAAVPTPPPPSTTKLREITSKDDLRLSSRIKRSAHESLVESSDDHDSVAEEHVDKTSPANPAPPPTSRRSQSQSKSISPAVSEGQASSVTETLALSAMANPAANAPDRTWRWTLDRYGVTRTLPSTWVYDRRHYNDDFDCPVEYENCLHFVRDYYSYVAVSRADLVNMILPTSEDATMKALCGTLKTYLAQLSDPEQPSTPGEQKLRQELTKLLENCAHDILRTVAHARYTKNRTQHERVQESEFQRYWDLLLEYGFDNIRENGNVAILYEQEFRMPCNELYDESLNMRKGIDNWKLSTTSDMQRQLVQDELLFYSGAASLTSQPYKEDAKFLFRVTGTAEMTHNKQVALLEKPSESASELAHRMKTDPRIGRCDAMGVLRIPNVFHKEDLRRTHPYRMVYIPEPKRREPGDGSVQGTQGLRGLDIGREADVGNSRDLFPSARSATHLNTRGTHIMDVLNAVDSRSQSTESSQTRGSGRSEVTVGVRSVASISSEDDAKSTSNRAAGHSGHTRRVIGPNPRLDTPMASSQYAHHPSPDTRADGYPPYGPEPPLPPTPRYDPHETLAGPRTLLSPFFAVENKKDKDTFEHSGANQLRVYCTGMAKYQDRALGLINFPVYGLLTEGTVGVVICAWIQIDELKSGRQSRKAHVTHIMERNGVAFDIADPRDALNFVTFLFKLSRVHGKALEEKLKARCEELRRGENVDTKWTQEQQNPKTPRRKAQSGEKADGSTQK